MAGPTALVRVEGRGSFKVSTALKEFIQAAIEGGATAVVVDLARCINMDSTFMGILAGSAGRILRQNQGRLALVNLTPKTRALIATLGLDQVVDAHDEGQTPDRFRLLIEAARVAAPDAEPATKRELTQTMIEAHETLTGLNAANVTRFKDVIDYLREDLRRNSGGSGTSG